MIEHGIGYEMKYILLPLFVILLYIGINWLNEKYFDNAQYIKAIRSLVIGFLFMIIFSRQIITEIAYKQYAWLLLVCVFFGYFIYMFFRDISKKEE